MRPRVTSVGLILPPDPSVNFTYPIHIDRGSLEVLPAKPGIYRFLSRDGLPLYIGKSINIRTRVLSHLRNPDEAPMLKDACSVDFKRTAGEIGALLLESHLVKKTQPPYNAQLRSIGETFAITLGPRGNPEVIGSAEAAENGESPRYGLFTSRGAAQEGLQALVRQHMLCPVLTRLETNTLGRACFARQIGRCRGACIGAEPASIHAARLLAALQQLQEAVWPFAGRIGIIEEGDGLRQTHVIDRWCYLGSLDRKRRTLRSPARHFVDIDTYKILSRPLLSGQLRIVSL
jgi:excinuclease Cho